MGPPSLAQSAAHLTGKILQWRVSITQSRRRKCGSELVVEVAGRRLPVLPPAGGPYTGAGEEVQ